MTILCPIDFSGATGAVVRYAAALAAGMGAELRLLHVLEPSLGLTVAAPSSDDDDLGLAWGLAHYRQEALGAGARVSTAVVRGAAAPAIVAEAGRYPADLLVIGAHGQTGLTRFLMGSTAETVVRTAPCVTLLVKPGCAAPSLQAAS